MAQRLAGAALIALLAAFAFTSGASAHPREHWYSGDGYDWWQDCAEVPDPIEFLPIYLGSDSTGFIDLGRSIVRGTVGWRVMQYTRDKDLGVTRIETGRWYGGMGADEWPVDSPYAARHLDKFRVVAWEIDGDRHPVDPNCTIVLKGDDHTIGFYNAWVRFADPGVHTLKIFGRQVDYFFFTATEAGLADPFGLEGRRVFAPGESVGDVLDDEFVHSYELHVSRNQ